MRFPDVLQTTSGDNGWKILALLVLDVYEIAAVMEEEVRPAYDEASYLCHSRHTKLSNTTLPSHALRHIVRPNGSVDVLSQEVTVQLEKGRNAAWVDLPSGRERLLDTFGELATKVDDSHVACACLRATETVVKRIQMQVCTNVYRCPQTGAAPHSKCVRLSGVEPGCQRPAVQPVGVTEAGSAGPGAGAGYLPRI